MGVQSKTIKFNASTQFLDLVTRESNQLGLSIGEFFKMLASNYISIGRSTNMTNFEKRMLERGQREISEGKYTSFDSVDDLNKYLMNL